MKTHYQYTDIEFEEQFSSCKLSPSLFTHEAHIRLAWILIHKLGINEAEKRIQDLIKKFVAHVGAQGKYNTTLTVAAIHIVYHFIQKNNIITFKEFVSEYPQLNVNFKELVMTHYSFDIFNSVEAKSNYIAPDLVSF